MNKPINLRFCIKLVDWSAAQAELRQVRQRVFIEEQQVPIELEWDGLDDNAFHILAISDLNQPIGCARILSNGAIGRMAVLKEWRKQGVGKALLDAAVTLCGNQGWRNITLSAQTHAIPFYERAGFVVCSEEYVDAGIPHCDMRLEQRS